MDIIASQLQVIGEKWREEPVNQSQQLEENVTVYDSDGSRSIWDVSSDSECESDLNQGLPRSVKGVTTINNVAKQVLEATQLAIKCLYTIHLRKPAPMDRPRDKFSQDRKPLPHTIYDQLYIRDKFPALDALVQMRLARMITRRRELLEYRRQHSKKLTLRKMESSEREESHENAGDAADACNDRKQRRAIEDNADKDNSSKPRRGHMTEYTKATTIRIEPESLPGALGEELGQSHHPFTRFSVDDDARTSVAGSHATREIQIEVPPRPKGSHGVFATFFKCNYCCLPVQIETDRAWRFVLHYATCSYPPILRYRKPEAARFLSCVAMDCLVSSVAL